MQQFDENENSVTGLLERQVEAMLFVSPQPVSSQEIASYLGVSQTRVDEAVKTLKDTYARSHGLTILFVAGGWQMATSPDLAEAIEAFS
ncbi:MAG: SMC-Scp complex subunit ScpB, partial [Synergistaceae bacterium]